MNVLRRAWETWKGFGRWMGDAIGRAVLTVFYFTVFVPFGLGVRLLADPLDIRGTSARWRPRETRDLKLEDGRRLS